MNHLQFGLAESKAANQILPWEKYVERCGQLCKAYINGNFDGDQQKDGYSLDWLYDQYNANISPIQIRLYLKRKLG